MRRRQKADVGSGRAIAVAAAMALVLSACGNGDDGENGSATDTDDQVEEVEPEAEETEETTGALAGETIDFVVPYDPGGGYDSYVRLISPVLGECLDANVVPRNEPGAGSLLATNQTFVADPDGTRIQILNGVGVVPAQIAGAEGVNFDLSEFSWLARIAGEPEVLSVAADSDFQTLEDFINAERPVRFVSTGPGSSEQVGAVVFAEAYGLDYEIVTGFAGSGEARASMVQGDADGHFQTLDSVTAAEEAGDIRIIGVVGEEHPDAPNAQSVLDYPAESAELQEVLEAAVSLGSVGRPVVGPPGLSDEVLTELRAGMDCALSDPDFLEAAAAQQRPIGPLPGDEVAAFVDDLIGSTPDLFRELVEASF
jgi:tripartite-type tricarboxylate transporter receptor subunit TctC